jgi:hypothetical protein
MARRVDAGPDLAPAVGLGWIGTPPRRPSTGTLRPNATQLWLPQHVQTKNKRTTQSCLRHELLSIGNKGARPVKEINASASRGSKKLAHHFDCRRPEAADLRADEHAGRSHATDSVEGIQVNREIHRGPVSPHIVVHSLTSRSLFGPHTVLIF